MNKQMSIWKMIGYGGLLSLLCIVSFLTAKYIIRDRIGWDTPPVDVSGKA